MKTPSPELLAASVWNCANIATYDDMTAAEERARAELLRARREAVAVRMSRAATLPYAVGGDHDKPSPVAVEAGDVVKVESWEGNGWTAHVGGIGVFVPVRIATPCEAVREAETENDTERKPTMPGGAACPAQVENEAAESPMAGVQTAAATVAQGNAQTGEEQARNAPQGQSRTPSEPRAKRERSASKERTKSEPESPWGTRRMLSVVAATAGAGCGGNETRVLLALTRFMAEGDATVWRSAEDVCSECRINDKSRQKAMAGLISKGLIQCAQHSHRGSAAEYAVLFPWL